MVATIYKATNKVNNKSYIGFDIHWPSRINDHLWSLDRESSVFHRAIKKYGTSSFTWEVIYQSLDSNHCKNIMENYFIEQYRTYIGFDDCNGYNMTLGGDGTLGYKHSEQTKKLLSEQRIGIKFSEETRSKLSSKAKETKNFKGKKHTEETKQKMREKKLAVNRQCVVDNVSVDNPQ